MSFITYPRPGLYNINLLVDLGLPTQTSFCRQVRIDTLPQGAFQGDTVCYGVSPALLFQASDGAAPFSIDYDDGSGLYTQGNLDGHSAVPLPYPLTAPGATTFYDTVTVDVPMSSTKAMVLPNSFTPNGDGHNDCFGIQRWGHMELQQFSVYNRWGARVFNTKNPAECWDGTYKGQMQPTGGYVYVIQAKTVCGFVTRTGTVMLIR